MRTKFLKLLTFICVSILLCAALTICVCADSDTQISSGQQYIVSDVVKSSLTAYGNISNYNGIKLKTDLSPEDIIEFTVTDHGGITKDGYGNLVFSNYANISISLKTEDSSMEIPEMGAYIISERDYSYDGKYVGRPKKQELKTKIGYGAIITSCEASSGSREIFEEMFFRRYDDRVDELRITKDGDYHIVILMTVKENGIRKKIAIEYIVPIRTKLYITDEYGEYHVKDAGAYFEAVRLDTLGRPNAKILVDGVTVEDGYILDKKGKHVIDVYGNGFLCERVNFEIFSPEDEHAYIYLSNSRKQLDAISYECENHFKVTWSTSYNSATMTYWKNNDPNTAYYYTKGEEITTPGTYIFTLNIPELMNEKKSFLVCLVENDEPILNYNTLHKNRFNNFKTKWYEIYDDVNEFYYCFGMDEYINAYDAAITIEKSKVTDFGYYFQYNDTKYTDKVSLTKAMNEKALANIKEVYYDPDAEKIEKYFSDRAFDGTVYLNPDFQFVRTSPAETDSVTLISSDGTHTAVSFFTPISAYKLKAGVYTVIEKDRYGNQTSYTCNVDTTVPTATLNINGSTSNSEVYDKMTYTARFFQFAKITDSLDPFAVIAVNHVYNGKESNSYYYLNEYDDAIFSDPGIYNIRIYDRNNNTVKFIVNIPNNKQYTISQSKNETVFSLAGSNISISSVLVNGVAVNDYSGMTSFKILPGEEDAVYTIFTVNNSSGERDCARFIVEQLPKEGNMDNTSNDPQANANSKDGVLSLDATVLIISLTVIVAITVCVVITIKIWRRRI